MDYQLKIPMESFWYAAFTRSRHEKVAAATLNLLDICHFLPLITEVHRWSDRKQRLSVPLFPGYVFVKIVRSSDVQLRVLKAPGVISFVGNCRGPAVIPEEEIESIRTIVTHGIGLSPYPFLLAGDHVRIVHGPLAGVEGIYLRAGRDSKLIISIEMIQRSVAINIDGCDVEPLCRRCGSYDHFENYLPAAA
jgi:transcription termination/antitermination protein NusG